MARLAAVVVLSLLVAGEVRAGQAHGHQAPAADHDPSALASGEHGASVPVTGGSATAGAPHGAAAGQGKYVATGSRAKPAAAARSKGKTKPVVSGLARPDGAHPPDAHESASTAENAHASPASAPAAGTPAPATTAPTRAPEEPATTAPAPGRGLARLSDVHERIAAALASLKEATRDSAGGSSSDGGGRGDGHGTAPRTRRITLSWPAPRLRVVWPMTSSVPNAGPHATLPAEASAPVPAKPAAAVPAPIPALPKPPDGH